MTEIITPITQENPGNAPSQPTASPEPPPVQRTEQEKVEVVTQATEKPKPRSYRIAAPPDMILPDGSPFTFDHTYVQKPMSMLAQLNFNQFIKTLLAKLTTDDETVDVEKIIGLIPGSRTEVEYRGLEAIGGVLMQALDSLPDLFVNIFKYACNVPPSEMPVVEAILAMPSEEHEGKPVGGLTKDQGMELIDTFIDQNAGAISDFFQKDAMRVGNKLRAVIFPAQES